MPNSSVPAAANGLPVTRRRTLIGLAGLAAGSAVATPALAETPGHGANEPKGYSSEQVERLMEAAYLYGCLPPDQRKIALAQLKELMRQRRELI